VQLDVPATVRNLRTPNIKPELEFVEIIAFADPDLAKLDFLEVWEVALARDIRER
jgi:hypothetical protein